MTNENRHALMSRIIKSSKNEYISPILDSKVFDRKSIATTGIPMLDVALSAKLHGGISSGILQIAGQSKHFKSGFALVIAAAWQRANPDGILILFDVEFGMPKSYMENMGIDMSRVIHIPITDIEQMKFEATKMLKNEIKRGDKVMFIIDSIGNIASLKEVEDAENEKSVTDMTRAKQMKSFFRIVTPHLNIKDIPMIVINHTYQTIEMFSKEKASGGTGAYYSSDDIWIIGRQQDKDGKELEGYHFIIRIEKSRSVREGAKIPITVSFEKGINRYSGLFDAAMEGNFITQEKLGWYKVGNQEKLLRKKDIIDDTQFWDDLLEDDAFNEYIHDTYRLKSVKLGADDNENGSAITETDD